MSDGHRHGRTPAKSAVIPDFRYIDTDSEVAAFVDELAGVDRYGIDTEFVRERTYFARLALVQIAWDDGIVLIDPERVDPRGLAPLISGPSLAILHASDQDLEVIERSCGVLPKQIFDTQLAAGFIGMSTPSLQTLIESLLSLRIEKGDQLADWSKRPLGESQLRYAAGDVAFLLELHDVLVKRLSHLGRLDWAETECAEILSRPRTPTVPDEAWWRIKQARQLRGRARHVAQCVAAWREHRAQSLDVPTRFILSDLALASIAHRPPRSRTELSDVRGVDERHLGGGTAEELLGAIEKGATLDSSELRLPPTQLGDNAPKAAVMLAAAWAGELAHKLRIDPSLLATRADLSAYLREPPSGRLLTSWRGAVVGEPLRRLVAGEASLALSKGTNLVLEERSGRPIAMIEQDPDAIAQMATAPEVADSSPDSDAE